MGSDGVYTGLVLGPMNHHREEKSIQSIAEKNENLSSKFGNNFLTLALSGGTNQPASISDVSKQISGETCDVLRQASSAGTVSSFSNSSSLKRDRDFCDGDEIEAETQVEIKPVSSKVSEEEEDRNGSPRKKLRLTKDQSAILEYSFKEHATLNPKQKQDLATKLSLSTRQIEVWFQNRRARTKLKKTEESCKLLKKCCESLTEENNRIKKALQGMKTLKSAPHPPFYMQLKTATLSICPSCERIRCVGDGSSLTSSLSAGPNADQVVVQEAQRGGYYVGYFINPPSQFVP